MSRHYSLPFSTLHSPLFVASERRKWPIIIFRMMRADSLHHINPLSFIFQLSLELASSIYIEFCVCCVAQMPMFIMKLSLCPARTHHYCFVLYSYFLILSKTFPCERTLYFITKALKLWKCIFMKQKKYFYILIVGEGMKHLMVNPMKIV